MNGGELTARASTTQPGALGTEAGDVMAARSPKERET